MLPEWYSTIRFDLGAKVEKLLSALVISLQNALVVLHPVVKQSGVSWEKNHQTIS